MTTTAAPPARGARRSAFDRTTAMRLAADEYGRYLDQLRSLSGPDWERPTDCPAWDVRAMATHNLGMAEMVVSLREFARQNAGAARAGGDFLDALTATQVRERSGLGPAQVVDRYAAVVPRTARGRRLRATQLGWAPMPVAQLVNGVGERWAFGFLFDTVLTRDTWMHRVDTALATGRPLLLTPEHDGVLVADVAAEWAARHGRPCTLTLTGPAGGSWSFGDGGPALELDAVAFCRTVSHRIPGEGLLRVEVPF